MSQPYVGIVDAPSRALAGICLPVALCLLALVGCSQPSVHVEKAAAQIEHKLEPLSASALFSNERAHTEWAFGCSCRFNFEVDSHSVENGSYHVRLRITGIQAKLTLPITIFLPENADQQLAAHENGHVRICISYYEQAQKIAEKLGREIIGERFDGGGTTFDAACCQAIDGASNRFGSQYRMETIGAVNRVSQLYDQLQAESTDKSIDEVDRDIQKAFEAYRKERHT